MILAYNSYLQIFKRSSASLKNKSKKKTLQNKNWPTTKNSQHFLQPKPTILAFSSQGLKSALAAFISYRVASVRRHAQDQLHSPSHAPYQTDTPPARLLSQGLVMLSSSPRSESTNTQGPTHLPRAGEVGKQGWDARQRCTEVPHQEGDADHQDLSTASLRWSSLPCSSTQSLLHILHLALEQGLSEMNVDGGVGTLYQLINFTINNTSRVTWLISDYQDVS